MCPLCLEPHAIRVATMLTDTLMRAVSLLLARFTLQNDHQMLFSFWVMVLALHPLLSVWESGSRLQSRRHVVSYSGMSCLLKRRMSAHLRA